MTDDASLGSPRSLGRLAAEFAVIVVGVLVALGVDAAREAHNDRQREEVYLQQLRADLATTAQGLASAISMEQAAVDAADRVIAGLNVAELPNTDSLGVWILRATASSATFHPTMGTVTALVESGELRLLRDDELRQSVLKYHTAVASSLRIIDGVGPHSWRTLEAVGRTLNWATLVDPTAPARFPVDWAALAADPHFHGLVYDMRLSNSNRLFGLQTLTGPLEDLEARLVGTPD